MALYIYFINNENIIPHFLYRKCGIPAKWQIAA